MPSWQTASSSSLESAATEEMPLVVYFADETDGDFVLYGDDYAELSKSSAVFIKVPYTEDREESPWAEDSEIPTNRLLSDNPAREYDVRVGKATVIVCDWHGNEYFREDNKVRANRLEAMIKRVPDQVKKANDKLERNYERADKEKQDGDIKGALRYLSKNFDDGNGPVGLPAQENSIRLYHEIMDDSRAKIEKLEDARDVDGLKELKKELRRTALEDEIDEAIVSVKEAPARTSN